MLFNVHIRFGEHCDSRPACNNSSDECIGLKKCLIKNWFWITFQFQLHTRIAYKPIYTIFNSSYILPFITNTDIKNNAWVTVNNDFWSRVGWFANDFHEWRSEKSLANHLPSDQKIVIHSNECIILFLTRCFTSWTYRPATNNHRSLISPLSLRTVFSDNHCDVITVDLWRRANARHWHCDVIFVDCSCTRKLAQRRSLLVNNNREYRFLTTRYSRLSV